MNRFSEFYTTVAVAWLSTSILVALAIGASYVVVGIRESRQRDAGRNLYSSSGRAAALLSLSPSEAAQLFHDIDEMNKPGQYSYRPWVGFSERSFHSRFLNVDDSDPLPVRRTINPADQANNVRTIWLFGGSTQFGWGVADAQTIASDLARILSTGPTHYRVVNHGHMYFYSSQESVLLTTLLRHGQKCDTAVFLDGPQLEESYPDDAPLYTDQMAAAFARDQRPDSAGSRSINISRSFAPVRLLFSLLPSPKSGQIAPHRESRAAYDLLKRYRFNMTAIQKLAEQENIKASFYWEPTPFDYLKEAENNRKELPYYDEIPRFNLSVRRNVDDRAFHFIADLFSGEKYEDVYVDRVHYGDKGCRLIAQSIAAGLEKDGLLHR